MARPILQITFQEAPMNTRVKRRRHTRPQYVYRQRPSYRRPAFQI